MNAFSSFFKGIDYFFKGLSFLFGKGLWYYMLYPMLLWIGMFAAAIFLVGGIVESIDLWLKGYLNEWFTNKTVYSVKLDFLVTAISFITGLLLRLAFYFIGGTIVKYLTLLLLSPMLSRLSEVLESKLTGKKFKFSFGQFMKDVARGVSITLRNMLFEYLFIIAGFVICFFFPPAVFIVTPVLFFISCYYYGFTMMDYSCERHRMSIAEGTAFIKQNKTLVCGVGCCLWLLFKIPTLYGDLIALTIGPAAACIGATLAFHELRNEKRAEVQGIHS